MNTADAVPTECAGDPNVDAAGSDDQKLLAYGEALADTLIANLAPWVGRVVEGRWADWVGEAAVGEAAGGEAAGALADAAAQAGDAAVALAAPRLRRLVRADADALKDTPLSIVRDVVALPTAVLRGAGVPPIVRDSFDRERFPDDDYGLTPANLGEIHPDIADLALRWGAARAFVLAARRRAEGRR